MNIKLAFFLQNFRKRIYNRITHSSSLLNDELVFIILSNHPKRQLKGRQTKQVLIRGFAGLSQESCAHLAPSFKEGKEDMARLSGKTKVGRSAPFFKEGKKDMTQLSVCCSVRCTSHLALSGFSRNSCRMGWLRLEGSFKL